MIGCQCRGSSEHADTHARVPELQVGEVAATKKRDSCGGDVTHESQVRGGQLRVPPPHILPVPRELLASAALSAPKQNV